MADEIIAGRNTPIPVDATNQQDAVDILENKLTQLRSLLSCCYGDWSEWFEAIGGQHRDNLMWLASDLAGDIARLAQELLTGLNAIDQPKA